MFRIFISTPMSVIASDKYGKFRADILAVIRYIDSRLPSLDIHYSGIEISDNSHFESSAISFRRDVAALEKSKLFVLIYPEQSATSALIELGYALRMKIPVFIFFPNRSMLPYMIKNLDEVLENAHLFEYGNMELLDFFRGDNKIIETFHYYL